MSCFDEMANAIEELSELPTLQQFIASVDAVTLREAVLGLHLPEDCKSIEDVDAARAAAARQRLDACIAELCCVEIAPNADGLVVLFEEDQEEGGSAEKVGFACKHCDMSLPHAAAENYSLEFVRWRDVLGWRVSAGNCTNDEKVALAASAVWSITFCGYTEKDVDAYL